MLTENTQATNEFDITIDGNLLRVARIAPAVPSQGVPIVFLHDSWGCIQLWRDFPELLVKATGHEAVIYDRQGYGKAGPFTKERTPKYLEEEAAILIKVIDACKIDKCILLGHSDGGSIALVAAAIAPNRIAGIIVEGAHVFVEEVTLQGIRDASKFYDGGLRSRLEKYHGEKVDAVFAAWRDTWLSKPFHDWNIEHYLKDIRCPVMAVQGIDDEYGTEAQVDSIVGQVSGPAEKVMLPKVGHTPHREAPDVVLDIFAQFIESIGK